MYEIDHQYCWYWSNYALFLIPSQAAYKEQHIKYYYQLV